MKYRNYATYAVENWVIENATESDLNVTIGQAECLDDDVVCITEPMYKDIYEGIKDGTYKAEADVTKTPHVMVTCEGQLIAHNEACEVMKETLENQYNKLLSDQNTQVYAKEGLMEIRDAVEKNTLCGFKANMLACKLQELSDSEFAYRLDYLVNVLVLGKERKLLIPDDEALFNLIKEDPVYVARQMLLFKKKEITPQDLRECKIFDKYHIAQIEPELYRVIATMGEGEKNV